MSAPEAAPAAPDPAFQLRGEPPGVMRLSRRALTIMGTAAAFGIGGALVWALTPHAGKQRPAELYDTNSKNIADKLASMPKDYSQVPKLGPPLPGDLGRPIVAAQTQGKDVPTPAIGAGANGVSGATSLAAAQPQSPQAAAAAQAAQQALAIRDSARTSKLFTGDQSLTSAAAPAPEAAAPSTGGLAGQPGAASPASSAEPAGAVANMQSSKRAFLSAPADRKTVSEERLEAPASPYVVQAGSVIAAALITGLESDLPGQITAQVTENVYDSPTGHTLLIPQGARLVGEYDSQVTFGQERVLMAWTRLILPDGKSIALERQPGADAAGYAGLQDGVNNHWGKLFQAAMLSTILSVGSEAGTSNSENNLAQAIRQGASQSFSQAGQQIVEHELNIQPTLTIRPGMPVRVMVTHDLVFSEPYGADHGG
jgi:type IV secretory pathway VirB10-like protein